MNRHAATRYRCYRCMCHSSMPCFRPSRSPRDSRVMGRGQTPERAMCTTLILRHPALARPRLTLRANAQRLGSPFCARCFKLSQAGHDSGVHVHDRAEPLWDSAAPISRHSEHGVAVKQGRGVATQPQLAKRHCQPTQASTPPHLPPGSPHSTRPSTRDATLIAPSRASAARRDNKRIELTRPNRDGAYQPHRD